MRTRSPLAAVGWAEDDEDELPPLDAAWANEPRAALARETASRHLQANPATIPPTLPAEVSFRA